MPLDPTMMLHPVRRELGPTLRQRAAMALLLLVLAPPSGTSLPEDGADNAGGSAPAPRSPSAKSDFFLQ